MSSDHQKGRSVKNGRPNPVTATWTSNETSAPGADAILCSSHGGYIQGIKYSVRAGLTNPKRGYLYLLYNKHSRSLANEIQRWDGTTFLYLLALS